MVAHAFTVPAKATMFVRRPRHERARRSAARKGQAQPKEASDDKSCEQGDHDEHASCRDRPGNRCRSSRLKNRVVRAYGRADSIRHRQCGCSVFFQCHASVVPVRRWRGHHAGSALPGSLANRLAPPQHRQLDGVLRPLVQIRAVLIVTFCNGTPRPRVESMPAASAASSAACRSAV